MRETETSHFWVGHFPEKRAADYFTEVWDENDEDREHTPLSAFAHDQGIKWYDHDSLEYGFKKRARSIEELVKGHLYSDQWAAELVRRAIDHFLAQCVATCPNALQAAQNRRIARWGSS